MPTNLKNPDLEAGDVERHLALVAQVHRLHVGLLVQSAVPAVPAHELAPLLLCVGDPVLGPVEPEIKNPILESR
jgi:hypothetical protein